MNKIFESKHNSKLTANINFNIEVKNDGFYLIKIVGRAGSWWQQLPLIPQTFWRDDELAISINREKVKYRINGNNLFGTRQYIFLVTPLIAGNNTLDLMPKNNPLLETIEVYEFNFSEQPLDLLSLIEEKFPEDTALSVLSNRKKNWILLHSTSTPVIKLHLDVRAKSGKQLPFLSSDDQDLQIKINGIVQKNSEPKSHNFWYWCGRTSMGKEKTFDNSLGEEQKVKTIELISDRSPLMTGFKVSFKRIPTVNEPEWTGNHTDDTDSILLARLIFSEAEDQSKETKLWVGGSILNRVNSPSWPDSIRNVIFQASQYDPVKSKDPNHGKFIDPLAGANVMRESSWRESYEISRDLLSGKTKNPTDATHFHGRGVSKEWFLANIVPQGRWIRTIDDTSFYWSPN